MKKVFILYTKSHNKYLVGFCTNFDLFVIVYLSHRQYAADTAEYDFSGNKVVYKDSSGDPIEMWAETIRDNETCFMKSVE